MIIKRLNNEFHPYPKEKSLFRVKKKNPKRDPRAIKEFKKKHPYCIICGRKAEAHHKVSRGAGGADTENNLAPFCWIHHTEYNRIGKGRFLKKYPEAKNWLKGGDLVREN